MILGNPTGARRTIVIISWIDDLDMNFNAQMMSKMYSMWEVIYEKATLRVLHWIEELKWIAYGKKALERQSPTKTC